MFDLVQDGDCDWSIDVWDMLMALLGEALVTGRDDGVGMRVRALAVSVGDDGAAAEALAQLQQGDQYTAWEAFLLGSVAGVVRQARELAPEMCQRVLRRWKGQLWRAGEKKKR
jgi:hypothetical protein